LEKLCALAGRRRTMVRPMRESASRPGCRPITDPSLRGRDFASCLIKGRKMSLLLGIRMKSGAARSDWRPRLAGFACHARPRIGDARAFALLAADRPGQNPKVPWIHVGPSGHNRYASDKKPRQRQPIRRGCVKPRHAGDTASGLRLMALSSIGQWAIAATIPSPMAMIHTV
jgi:hypothetical protein